MQRLMTKGGRKSENEHKKDAEGEMKSTVLMKDDVLICDKRRRKISKATLSNQQSLANRTV